MTKKACDCGGHKQPGSCGQEKQGSSGQEQQGGCAACKMDDIFSYWCKSCNRSVSEKRCPYCGLKAQRKRSTDGG
jgi:hypothetical protein